VLKIFAAWIVYAALSLLFFGLPIINHLSQTYIGGGTDPICHIWSIAWWPYAIEHRLNPLITHALWAPAGYNLVWGTDIPGPSLIIYPITRIFGPVVSYNLLCLLAPPAAAASTFVLCHYVCGRFWPALVGGYIFGFSPWEIAYTSIPMDAEEVSRLLERIAWYDYPRLAEHRDQHMAEGPHREASAFEVGLDLILDGLTRARDAAAGSA